MALVLWWRCPACKRLVEEMAGGVEGRGGGEFPKPVALYFYDPTCADRAKTLRYLRAVEEGGDPWLLLLDFAKAPSSQEGNAGCESAGLLRAWDDYFVQIGLGWTPGVLWEEEGWVLLPPKAETYTRFLEFLRE